MCLAAAVTEAARTPSGESVAPPSSFPWNHTQHLSILPPGLWAESVSTYTLCLLSASIGKTCPKVTASPLHTVLAYKWCLRNAPPLDRGRTCHRCAVFPTAVASRLPAGSTSVTDHKCTCRAEPRRTNGPRSVKLDVWAKVRQDP